MTTVLLIIIYLGYISLGLPDSLFGAAWPAIYTEFNLPVSSANAVTVLVCTGTVIASMCSARVVKKFGTGGTAAISTTLTAIALLGFSLSENLIWLCIFAVPLGFGAGAIDTALNNYVALHYSAMHMNFLHCFYGVGVSVSPYIMSLSLAENSQWRNGYRIVFFIQITIAVITIITLPLWKKVTHSFTEEEKIEIKILPYTKMIKNPAIRAICFSFIGNCAIESVCTSWSSTYLVEAKGCSADKGAMFVMFYFLGLAFGRFISGLISSRLSPWALLKIGTGITFAGIIITFLPFGTTVTSIGLFIIGFGIGPIFPNLTTLTPQVFGKDVSQSIIGAQMTATYCSIMFSPLIFGQIAEHLSIKLFSPFLLVSFVIMIISVAFFKKESKKTE